MPLSDLAADAFHILQDAFFEDDLTPKPFALRDKRNTQDDPLDQYIARLLAERLTDAQCQKSPGPNTSPDLVLYRPQACEQAPRSTLRDAVSHIVAVEVKKLDRQKSGQVARSTGADYNTTPPCGTVRIYDSGNATVDVRAFYLFVCQEQSDDSHVQLTALVLCDGDVLNRDFQLYLEITGQRMKGTGLGTYGDGANRNRPMLIFANPLGAVQFDHTCTYIARDIPAATDLALVYEIGRTIPEGGEGIFYASRRLSTIPEGWEVQRLVDPFPRPARRVTTTQARGKFKLPIRPLDDEVSTTAGDSSTSASDDAAAMSRA